MDFLFYFQYHKDRNDFLLLTNNDTNDNNYLYKLTLISLGNRNYIFQHFDIIYKWYMYTKEKAFLKLPFTSFGNKLKIHLTALMHFTKISVIEPTRCLISFIDEMGERKPTQHITLFLSNNLTRVSQAFNVSHFEKEFSGTFS